jgi:transposase
MLLTFPSSKNEEKDTLILSLFARLDALESKMNKANQNSSKSPPSAGLVYS